MWSFPGLILRKLGCSRPVDCALASPTPEGACPCWDPTSKTLPVLALYLHCAALTPTLLGNMLPVSAPPLSGPPPPAPAPWPCPEHPLRPVNPAWSVKLASCHANAPLVSQELCVCTSRSHFPGACASLRIAFSQCLSHLPLPSPLPHLPSVWSLVRQLLTPHLPLDGSCMGRWPAGACAVLASGFPVHGEEGGRVEPHKTHGGPTAVCPTSLGKGHSQGGGGLGHMQGRPRSTMSWCHPQAGHRARAVLTPGRSPQPAACSWAQLMESGRQKLEGRAGLT